jgi:arsenate reductase (thioredoxin)
LTVPVPEPLQVLVLCTGNSARSQIAEALLVTRGAGRVVATSAGTWPAARVHPLAVEVLARHGIAWSNGAPKSLEGLAGQRYHLVITVCDAAAEACPVVPGAAATVHWGLPDPAAQRAVEAARRAFEATFAALDDRIARLLALPIEHLEPAELARQARAIHLALEPGPPSSPP